jgi:uncharacterized protein (DUF3084 family)
MTDAAATARRRSTFAALTGSGAPKAATATVAGKGFVHHPLKRRLAASARQRAWRARRKAHRATFPVCAGEGVLDMLEATGWLLERDADDPKKVGEAIGALLIDAAKRL